MSINSMMSLFSETVKARLRFAQGFPGCRTMHIRNVGGLVATVSLPRNRHLAFQTGAITGHVRRQL